MPAQTVIKLRRDSAADWASVNPVLADGEVGLESDSGLVKYGNGTSQWSDLPYTTAASVKTKVQNNTGSSIPKGSVVYISGASGDNPRITLADADTEATSSKTLGITEAAIADGAQGYVIESGLITGLNTAAATAGQSVWLSSTAGEFVFNAPPAKPAHSVYLGVVIRAHANQGAILVKVQNGYELNELHDVNAGNPSTNDVLQWNGTAWVNADVVTQVTSAIVDSAPSTLDTLNELAAALGDDANFATTVAGQIAAKQDKVSGVSDTEIGYLDGVTSAIQTQLDGKAASSHTHAISDVTSLQTALDAKAPLASPTFTGTVSGITKSMVGLGNVDNTSDANKPISTATQAALDLKANIASPTFTGTVSGNASASSAAGDGAKAIGFKGLPASGAGATGAYTLTAGDAGEMVYTTTSRTVTIPSNASVPFEIGTSIVFISGAGATTTIAITSDTMLLAGTGATGSRTLAAHGMATAVKVAATTWYISGNGLT